MSNFWSTGTHRAQALVTVSTPAARLLAGTGQGRNRTFQNQGAATVYLGGPDVAASGPNAGYALAAGATFSDNASADPWYGITAGDAVPVLVIEVY